MPKVFYTGQPRASPPLDRTWSSDGTGSEAETDVEYNERPDSGARAKISHKRAESMDVDAETNIAPKRLRRAGNAVVRQRQASREVRDSTGQRPLQKACSRGDISRVKNLLLNNNPDLQDRDYAGTTALHTAALQGNEQIVKALLDAGAVPDVRSGPEELDTPLMDAAANGFLPIVHMLLNAGADPRITNAMGRIAEDFVDDTDKDSSAIIDALRARTKTLRSRGAKLISSPNHADAPPGLFPPGFAGVQRPAAPVFLDISKRSARNEIIEHAAMGDLEYVGSALERGWRPNAEALVKAAKYGHAEVAGLLLAFGLTSDVTFNGASPLKEAIQRGHLATVKLLLDSGAVVKSEYKRLVDDLPDWDELKSIVLGKPQQMAPERVMFRKESRIVSDDEAEPQSGPQSASKPEPQSTSKLESQVESKSESKSESKVEPKLESTPGPKLDSQATERRPSGESTSRRPSEPAAPKPASQPALKPRSESRVSFHRPDFGERRRTPSDTKLAETEPKISKVDLRSIKPKKRKSSAESTPVSENASPLTIPGITTEPDTLNVPRVRESRSRLASISETESKSSDTESRTSEVPDVPEVPQIEAEAPKEPKESRQESRQESPHESREPRSRQTSGTRESPVPVEAWVERSQELNELAERKAKERRDREARMLESLVQEERRRSDTAQQPPPAAPIKVEVPDATSKAATPLDPSSEPESKQSTPGIPAEVETAAATAAAAAATATAATATVEVSVKQLPWILRRLAYTGEPQNVSPLFTHQVGSKSYYLDLQVALAAGEPQLHAKYPQLHKLSISAHHKQLLWPFCQPWVSKPGSTGEQVAEDHQRFSDLTLSWISVDDVDTHVFPDAAQRPHSLAIQLEPKPLPTRILISDLPLRWKTRAMISGRAW